MGALLIRGGTVVDGTGIPAVPAPTSGSGAAESSRSGPT